MIVAKRWTVFRRFIGLPALQRETLLRRRLPAWLSPKPTSFLRLKMQSPSSQRAERLPEDSVVLTCIPHPTTGSGHRFSEWNTGLIVARKAGVPFLDAGLGDGWDEAFGLTGNFAGAADYLKRHGPSIVRLPFVEWHDRPDALYELVDMVRMVAAKSQNTVVMLADGQNLFRQHDAIGDLRTFYRNIAAGHKAPETEQIVRIAVHVRRGDVARMKQQGQGDWQARYVDTNWFVNVLSAVVQGLGDRTHKIEIFSQGRPEDFAPFVDFKSASLCLDADPIWTFHRMATADLLIASPSSFSFNAGLVNPGLKLARSPWWHEIPQGDGWFPVLDDLQDARSISHFVRNEFTNRSQNESI